MPGGLSYPSFEPVARPDGSESVGVSNGRLSSVATTNAFGGRNRDGGSLPLPTLPARVALSRRTHLVALPDSGLRRVDEGCRAGRPNGSPRAQRFASGEHSQPTPRKSQEW